MDIRLTDEINSFLDNIFSKLEDNRISLKNWKIDHLCYRTSDEINYQVNKDKFSKLGKLLIESEVNGRLISTYKLHNPIVYKKYIIDVIEVPAPKINKATKEGFEHFEVVVDIPFEEIMQEYAHISFKTKAMSKTINPDIEINFGDYAVKFHHHTLEHVIEMEKMLSLQK